MVRRQHSGTSFLLDVFQTNFSSQTQDSLTREADICLRGQEISPWPL